MLRVGITGQTGFIGTHLYDTLGLYPDRYERIPFEDAYFENERQLTEFVSRCDVIVHLAALNRHPDPQVIYDTNLDLVRRLIRAMESEKAAPHVFFSSSTQEMLDNAYGRSKREGREMLEAWAVRSGARFTGLVVPNVFGPFGRPGYNSFIATFCHKLTHDEDPEIICDSSVRMIYVGSLCRHILGRIDRPQTEQAVVTDQVPYDFEKNVSQVLALLQKFRSLYLEQGIVPPLGDSDEINLFNTFRSYIDPESRFPVELVRHCDARGMFVETAKLGVGGQVSFSTTVPGITRGNHFHTRKIERFTVIRGKARIRLRRIGTDKTYVFDLDGDRPAYVDMPVWYTHNITNTGTDELYTQFWINEWYDPEDGDTFFENV